MDASTGEEGEWCDCGQDDGERQTGSDMGVYVVDGKRGAGYAWLRDGVVFCCRHREKRARGWGRSEGGDGARSRIREGSASRQEPNTTTSPRARIADPSFNLRPGYPGSNQRPWNDLVLAIGHSPNVSSLLDTN